MIYFTLNIRGMKLHLVDMPTEKNTSEIAESRQIFGDRAKIYKLCLENNDCSFFITEESLHKIQQNRVDGVDVVCPVCGTKRDALLYSIRLIKILGMICESMYYYEFKLNSSSICFCEKEWNGMNYYVPCEAHEPLLREERIGHWVFRYEQGICHLPVEVNDSIVNIGVDYPDTHDEYGSILVDDQYLLCGDSIDLNNLESGKTKGIVLAMKEEKEISDGDFMFLSNLVNSIKCILSNNKYAVIYHGPVSEFLYYGYGELF